MQARLAPRCRCLCTRVSSETHPAVFKHSVLWRVMPTSCTRVLPMLATTVFRAHTHTCCICLSHARAHTHVLYLSIGLGPDHAKPALVVPSVSGLAILCPRAMPSLPARARRHAHCQACQHVRFVLLAFGSNCVAVIPTPRPTRLCCRITMQVQRALAHCMCSAPGWVRKPRQANSALSPAPPVSHMHRGHPTWKPFICGCRQVSLDRSRCDSRHNSSA